MIGLATLTRWVVPSSERLLARELIDEALEGFEEVVPRSVVERLREKLIGELLWTAYGRELLARAATALAS